MWELIYFNQDKKELNLRSTFETENECLEARANENDIILFKGKLPETAEKILELEVKVRDLNKLNLRISLEPEKYPKNCWCMRRGSTGPPRDRCYFGTIECKYCNANGYCWIVDTGEICNRNCV